MSPRFITMMKPRMSRARTDAVNIEEQGSRTEEGLNASVETAEESRTNETTEYETMELSLNSEE